MLYEVQMHVLGRSGAKSICFGLKPVSERENLVLSFLFIR